MLPIMPAPQKITGTICNVRGAGRDFAVTITLNNYVKLSPAGRICDLRRCGGPEYLAELSHAEQRTANHSNRSRGRQLRTFLRL